MNLYEAIKNNLLYKYPSSHIYEYYSSEKEAKEVADELEREGKYVVDEIFPLGEEFGIWVHCKKDEDVCKRKWGIKESDSSFDVEGLADRIDILMADMDPYEHMDVYGSYNPTEESYQDTLDSLYNNPQSVLDSISSYDIIDWEDDIQTEYNEVIQDLKKWIKISRSKNESEDSSKKGYSVTIKMKNNKQVIHLFNTEDEMYEYLNLLSHYVGQGEVEILDYTGKDSKKNESEYVVYTTTEGNKLSPEELVKSAYEHITSELGEEATIEAVLDDIMNNYDQDYFKGETPEDSKNDFDSVRTYLRRLGLHYKDLDESEDDEYENPKYKVEIRDLHLTNHGYHNNSDIAWGRVKLIPKDDSGIDDSQFGFYDILYFRENDELFCFKIGYPVKDVANALYDYGTDDGNYTVKINGEDIPVDDLYEKIDRDSVNLSVDAEGAINYAVTNAIISDDVDKVNYQ